MDSLVISDTSCLIVLTNAGLLGFLHANTPSDTNSRTPMTVISAVMSVNFKCRFGFTDKCLGFMRILCR